MTDYILQFSDELSAQSDLSQYYNVTDGWDTSLTIPNIVVTDVNGDPALGWFIRITGLPQSGTTPFDQTGWICQPVFA